MQEHQDHPVAVVVYELVEKKWRALGRGEWSELHVFCRADKYRVAAWVRETREEVLNVQLSRETTLTLKADFGELREGREVFGMYFAREADGKDTACAISRATASLKPSWVSDVSHDTHVVYNESLARFEGLPDGWTEANKQFGVDAAQLPRVVVRGYDVKIPAVLVMLAAKFEALGGYTTPGVFRIAPDAVVCQDAKRAIDKGEPWQGDPDVDAHVVANLIKIFFRELPNLGLLNWLGDAAIAQIAIGNDVDIEKSVADLPEPHKTLLLWLLDLCVKVARKADINRMTAKNLAIVLSPNLYTSHAENPMAALTMAQHVADCTLALLNWRLG